MMIVEANPIIVMWDLFFFRHNIYVEVIFAFHNDDERDSSQIWSEGDATFYNSLSAC